MKKLSYSIAAFLILAFTGMAVADLSVKDGAGTTRTIFNFVCFTTKLCNATVLVDSAGTEIAPATHADMVALTAAVNGSIPAGSEVIGTVNHSSQYPFGATPITASATGTTAATTATLAGTSGKTTYICGYSIRANATAVATVTNTITGVITATLSSLMWVAPLASGIGIDEQIFSPCIPASATNTGIAIVSGAPGSGGAVSSKGWGYQL